MFTVLLYFFFFFNDTATTEIYTLSLHDALPIYLFGAGQSGMVGVCGARVQLHQHLGQGLGGGEQEIGRAPSELQSPDHLVCRLLLEKKKKLDTRRNKPRTARYWVRLLPIRT